MIAFCENATASPELQLTVRLGDSEKSETILQKRRVNMRSQKGSAGFSECAGAEARENSAKVKTDANYARHMENVKDFCEEPDQGFRCAKIKPKTGLA